MKQSLYIGIKKVPPFTCPIINESIDHQNIIRLRALQKLLLTNKGGSATHFIKIEQIVSIKQLPIELEKKLVHRLSPYFSEIHQNESSNEQRETHAYQQELAVLKDLRDEHEFLNIKQLLLLIIKQLNVPYDNFRKGAVKTTKDDVGNYVIYPDANYIETSLFELNEFVKQHQQKDALLTAIVVFSAINGIHPFMDGNGRTSRILFNHIIRKCLLSEFFIPISEISERSKGGLMIRLKDSVYNDNWNDLVDYFCNVIEYIYA